MSEPYVFCDESKRKMVLVNGNERKEFTLEEWRLLRKVVDEDLNNRYENLKLYVAKKEGR